MESLQWAVAFVGSVSTLVAMRLSWASYSLRSHPEVEPIEIAHPELSEHLHMMVSHISSIAKLKSSPSLFVRRAALPNAFIVASTFRPELYLTDELFEYCNECENPLQKLEQVICHEIAHLKRGDAIPLGLLTYAYQWSSNLRLKPVHQLVQSKISHIENETDKVAEELFKELNNLE